MRLPDTPAAVAASAQSVLQAGKTVGLRFSIVGSTTRADALRMAHALRDGVDRVAPERQLEGSFVARSTSPRCARCIRWPK